MKRLLTIFSFFMLLAAMPIRLHAVDDRFYLLVNGNSYTVSGTESEIPSKYKMSKAVNTYAWTITFNASDNNYFDDESKCWFHFQQFYGDNTKNSSETCRSGAPYAISLNTTYTNVGWVNEGTKDSWGFSNESKSGYYTIKFDRGSDNNGNTVSVTHSDALTVTISPNGGNISNSQQVTLTSPNGTDVYYTTNGTNPTTSSSVVASGSSITISDNATVKAGVYNNCTGNIEGISTATFTSTSTNKAGYYIYGARYDGTSPSKLHYKMQPVTGSSNEYYIDLLADDKTLAGVNLYSTGNDIDDTTANGDTEHKTYWADMNNSTFRVAYVPNDGDPYTTYWSTGNPTYQMNDGDANKGTAHNFGNENNLFQIVNNGGMYRFIITVDESGNPKSWRYESHPNEIVIYKLSEAADWTIDGFLYCTRKSDANKQGNYHGYNQKFFGTTSFTKDGEFAFLLGDKWLKRNKNNTSTTYTKNTSLADTDAPNLVFEYATGTYGVMYNPTQDEYQLVGAAGSGTTTPINIYILGNAVSTSELTSTYSNWSTTNSTQLTYNDEEGCWKASIPFYSNKQMRFLNNNNKATNWGEDSYAPTADGTCENGDTQLNNHVKYTSNESVIPGTNINFLKPSGTYTVRFYMKAAEGEEFSSVPEYWYTLTLDELSSQPGIMLVPDGQTDESNYTLRTQNGISYYNYNVGSNELTVNSILENATKFKYALSFAEITNIGDISSGAQTISGSDAATFFRNLRYRKVSDESESWWQCEVNDNASKEGTWPSEADSKNKGYVFVKVQAWDETTSSFVGEAKLYRYVFEAYNELHPSVSIEPNSGFYINKAIVTATNNEPSIGMRFKGGFATEAEARAATYTTAGMKDIETTSGTGTFWLSTPGYVAVVDEQNNVAVGNFDFTYSTSENYVNYYHNGTFSQSVSQAGGKDATNIFVQVNPSYPNLYIYAWNNTLDQKLIAAQDEEHAGWYHQNQSGELEKEDGTYSKEGPFKIYEGDRPGDDYYHYKETTIGVHERDPYVKLTPDFPGTALTSNRTFEIDGVMYYYLSLPYERLENDDDEVGFIVTQYGTDGNGNKVTDNTLYKTQDYHSFGNKSFIYTSNGANSWNNGYMNTDNNQLVDISAAIGGENAVFFHKPSSWSSNVYCHAWIKDKSPKYSWKSKEEKMGLMKTDSENGDLYGYNIPITSDDGQVNIIFFDGDNESYRFETDGTYTSGRKTYSNTGTLTTEERGIDSDYTLFLQTPGTTVVEVNNYPNGKDYVDYVSYDKTILLDPTWGGYFTSPLTNAQEETSISSWNGITDENGLRKIVDKEITQRIVGLTPGKTYTVQAIVRGWGEDGDMVSLKVGEGDAVELKFVNASAKSYVNKNGRVDDRYTEGPDPEDENIMHDADYGWIKIEASGTPTSAGNLDITLTPTFVGDAKKYDLADVVLLEEANTNGHYWTKLPTDSVSTAIKAGEIDLRDRTKYNAFSFFDRNEGNPNAIIKASNRTVIGLQSGVANAQAADGTVSTDAVDHRQSRNTISLNKDGETWSGRYLYLYDESDASMADDYSWSDCNAYGATVDFTMIGAKYDRKFTEDVHSTLFLPYSVTTAQLKAAGFKQLQKVDVANVKSDKIPLITWDLTKDTPTDYSTVAGQGYIVIAGTKSGKDYAALEDFYKPDGGIAVQKSAKTKEATGLVGAYKYECRYKESTVDGITYMNYSYWNDLFRVLGTEAQGGSEIKPFRATFAVPQGTVGSARQLSTYMISADELFTPTGISRQGVEEQLSGSVYTIDGRLVSTDGDMSKLTRGIYVRSGRKIVVK